MAQPQQYNTDDNRDQNDRLKKRMDRLDGYIADVHLLDREIQREAGKRVLTKAHWDTHNKFKTEKEGLQLQIAEVQKKYDAALAEQDGLAIPADDEAAVVRLEKLLTAKRAFPPALMQECYAMILHEHKTLDFIRKMSPNVQKVLFNFELQPLRNRVAQLERENYELNKSNEGDNEVQIQSTPNDLCASLQRELDAVNKRNQELMQQLGEMDSTQRIAETQLNQNIPALDEAVASLKRDIAQLRAELATKEKTIQLRDKKIAAFQARSRLLESKLTRAERAVDRANRATEAAEELRRELHVKKYDLSNSTRLNDFLQCRLATLGDETVAQLHAMDLHFQAEICQRDAQLAELDDKLEYYHSIIGEMDTEINGVGGYKETQTRLEGEKSTLESQNEALSKEVTDMTRRVKELDGAKNSASRLASEKSAVQKELRILKTALKECLPQALPLAKGDDRVWSAVVELLVNWPPGPLPATAAMGTPNSTSWIIKAPVTPTSEAMKFEKSSTLSLAVKLFVLVHTRRHEDRLALEILPELMRRVPSCSEGWAARIILACIVTFNADRATVVKTAETSSVSLSLWQLYGEIIRRFPSILSETNQRGPAIVATLRDYTRQCCSTPFANTSDCPIALPIR